MMKPRRGISAYIAVILLLLLAVSAGAVIYASTMGYLGGMPHGSGSTMGALSLDAATINQNRVTVYVRNLGGSPTEIDKVYINGTPAEEFGYTVSVNGPGILDDVINGNELGVVNVELPLGFEPGVSYEVKVFTKDYRQISFTKRAVYDSQSITTQQLVEDIRYVNIDTSNVDGYSDLGTLTSFVNVQTPPDSSYATLTEARLLSTNMYDFIDIGGTNVDGVADKGSHSSFDNLKSVDGILDTIMEQDTGTPETGFHVYHGSFEFASGTTAIRNIGATVDPNHSFLVVYTAGTSTSNEPDEGSCTGYISSSTQITFERTVSSPGLYVSWFLVECLDNEFTVRGRGTITLNAGIQSNTAAVSGVADPNQCIIMYGGHRGEGGSVNDWEDAFCNVHLTASDTVTAKRHSGSTGTRTNIRYEVVEWSSDYNIYTGEATVSSTTVTDLISGGGNPGDSVVDMSRSIMFANWWAEQNGIQQVQVYYSITDTNQVTLGQYSGGRNPLVRWYIVEFPAEASPSIQRYSYNWDPTTSPANVRSNPMSSVDTGRTFIRMSSSTSGTGTAFRRDFNLPRLDSSTTWSETQYNPATANYDQHETRASVIELPYTPQVINYEVDLEANFTGVDTGYDVTEICIRTGALDSEDLSLSIWDSSLGSWVTLTSDLTGGGWNNITITGYTAEYITVRILGGSEASDINQDSWEIDGILLTQHDQPYRLDHEMQWSNCNSSLDNAEICIFTGTIGVETVYVDIWDKTMGLWDTILPSLSQDTWNNATVKSYLIDDGSVTIRFTDSAISNDDTQSIWNIDSVLLRSWE